MKRAPPRLANILRSLTMFSATVVLVFAYQNCTEFKADPNAISKVISQGSSGAASADLVPRTDRLDSNCASNSAFDACIFQQNPVAMANGAQLSGTGTVRATELNTRQTYGVKLTSLAGNGKLENATVKVTSINTPELNGVPNGLKTVYPLAPNSSAFEQVMAYYWINRTSEYLDARLRGQLPAKGKGVKVVVDDTITGYNPTSNTIHLRQTSTSNVAWSGEILVHLFALANLEHASSGAMRTKSATKNLTCPAPSLQCCSSVNGCAAALQFGVGDYVAAIMFPNRPLIGETLVNTGQAATIAGFPRDMTQLRNRTLLDAYNSSGTGGSAGDVGAMGLVYANVWWEVRVAAGTNSHEVDQLFFEHLKLLNGDDDFRTALLKISNADSRLFAGRYTNALVQEFQRRGLTP
ncbi:MAG TPA: hypothetical protein PLZ57_12220 [Pseudobdellovibrionaceae bacterium]|nr:hypothetical protein [Pseudobdellovibrionaceae bacterium]